MSRRILVIEGTDCVGKTSVVQELQALIPIHNMVKLSAAPEPHMSIEYMNGVYQATIDLVKAAKHNHFIFDRFTTSERVYGWKYRSQKQEDYEHLGTYEDQLAVLDGYHVLLVGSEKALEARLATKVLSHPNEAHYALKDLVELQDLYIEKTEMYSNFPWSNQIVIETDGKTPREIALEIMEQTGV